ncbi:NAD(P)-binding protein [Decorospora gaudefroyi]|uniref:NAD(P)-binding protein n=1 Tax=Decorospora gaudefroyi TaxID=184978 RepID=A0A6A5KA00_9PLEO|nr:NAD(P)-binding protein [Decorospora gaudefroyi]
MAPPTIVLITGVGRGIGRALAAAYLSKPDHVVIGTVRDPKAPKAEELKSLPTASGSHLLLVGVENTNVEDPKEAVKTTEAAGIDHIDVVVDNSGVSIGAAPLEMADPKYFTESFNINVLSGVVLYQAVSSLLKKSSDPKWISVSSRGGSTSAPLPWYPYAAAYCMSKAAQNWFTQTLHVSNESLTAFAIHPGFVLTDMGIAAAIGAGIDLPETSGAKSARKIIDVISSATRESTSGKFLDVDTREEIPW